MGLQTAQPAPPPALLLPATAAAPPRPSRRGSVCCMKLQLRFPSLGLFFMGIANWELARLQLPGKALGGCLGAAWRCPPELRPPWPSALFGRQAVCHLGSYNWNIHGREKAGRETEAALVQVWVCSCPIPVSAGTLLASEESSLPSAQPWSCSWSSVLRADGRASCGLGSFYSKTRNSAPLNVFLSINRIYFLPCPLVMLKS